MTHVHEQGQWGLCSRSCPSSGHTAGITLLLEAANGCSKNAETSRMDFFTQLLTLKGWMKQFENLWADF